MIKFLLLFSILFVSLFSQNNNANKDNYIKNKKKVILNKYKIS